MLVLIWCESIDVSRRCVQRTISTFSISLTSVAWQWALCILLKCNISVMNRHEWTARWVRIALLFRYIFVVLIDFELAIAPSPRGNFRHYYFLIAQCLLSIFYLFCNLAIGAFGSYRGQRSSGALLHIVYYLTTKYVAFSCHFLNLVRQIIFFMV